MQFKKLFGPLRIVSASDGSSVDVALPPSSGGRFCKDLQYMILVTDKSGDNARVGVKLYEGPTRDTTWNLYGALINAEDPGEIPSLLVGDTTSTSAMLGEWLQAVLTISSSDATQQWAVVELFEMRKPF